MLQGQEYSVFDGYSMPAVRLASSVRDLEAANPGGVVRNMAAQSAVLGSVASVQSTCRYADEPTRSWVSVCAKKPELIPPTAAS